MPSITIKDMRRYQKEKEKLSTIGEFKELGRELRGEFGLEDIEAIHILNNNTEEMLNILEKYKDRKGGGS